MSNVMQASFLDTPQVEFITHRGYEQRVSFNLERDCWQCLSCEPAFYPPHNDFWGWDYGRDKDALIARVKAEVDWELDCIGVKDRADWDTKYKAREIGFAMHIRARWPQNHVEATA